LAEVILYQPDAYCNQCDATKRRFRKPGRGFPPIEYETVTVTPELAEQLKSEGHTSFPVVKATVGGETYTWSGYRHDEITKLAEKLFC